MTTVPDLIAGVKKTLNDAGLGPGQFTESQICEALRLAGIEISNLLELCPNQIELNVPTNRQIAIPHTVARILMVC